MVALFPFNNSYLHCLKQNLRYIASTHDVTVDISSDKFQTLMTKGTVLTLMYRDTIEQII
jgi:hypothetical protein